MKTLYAIISSILNFILFVALITMCCNYAKLKLPEKKDTEIPEIRVMCGNYHDYKVIETVDGNMWMIDDEFRENQLLQLMFDTKGTETVIDDEIIFIKEVD